MFRKQTLSAIVAGAISLTLAGYASAQQDNSNGGGGGNTPSQQNNGSSSRSGRRSFDPAQFRQQMMDRMKEMLGSSDDEWKVIEPRLDKVMQLQRESRGGGMGFMFGRSRDRGDRSSSSSQSRSESAVARAQADLRSALEDKSISADEIAKRLANYRQAKEQAKQDLVKAQADLKELLSQRQEAQLVMMGMLD